ncbi:oxidoreductase, 2OG-Fe(II) oxygenase family protein [Ancylostoma duodenale]|uniref:hypoxia-inducible factor-proline dioxygenase n=1 Tax=Ancylostoma duodenale TaxID=51022 RepID=A0A0C2BZP2_9BILA|nr:oxidoreductase, 2OG-Fe(II) oxygenase family protein [Ancylostoma duodenale]
MIILFQAMLAIYPGNGTRYVKHVDNPVKDGRCITTIYYCNQDWDINTHGGTLRLYPESSMIPMDIDPKADRLVFFWSDRRNPHEVMPVFKPRLV